MPPTDYSSNSFEKRDVLRDRDAETPAATFAAARRALQAAAQALDAADNVAPSSHTTSPHTTPSNNASDGQPTAEATNAPRSAANSDLLRSSLRRARMEQSARHDAMAEIGFSSAARLEALQDRLAPILAQIPPDCDYFDTGLMLGQRPRLFVDMIAFIEFDREQRLYRFWQDRRDGRFLLTEKADVNDMAQHVADYIAHRLIDREKALASLMSPPVNHPLSTNQKPSHDHPKKCSGLPSASAFLPPLWLRHSLWGVVFLLLISALAYGLWRLYHSLPPDLFN